MGEQYDVTKAVEKMSQHMANMYYYISKEMIETFGDDAKEALERAIVNFGRARGEEIARRVTEAGEDLTIENLDKYYDIPIAEGWKLHRKYEDGKKHNMTESCTFADVWLEKGWQEVGHIYCLVDIAIREGYSPNVIFKPGKNILKGDDCCTSLTVYRR